MSALSSLLLWAQAAPVRVPAWKLWLLVFGEPGDTIPGLLGGVFTWIKAVGLFSLVAWVGAWVVTAVKERKRARINPLDVVAMVALVGGVASVLLGVAQAQEQVRPLAVAGQPVFTLLGIACALVLIAWVEAALWAGVLRLGRPGDRIVLAGIHLALGLGIAGGLVTRDVPLLQGIPPLAVGVRLGATFMGYVVLLRIVELLAREVVAVRARRLGAIAWHTVIESNRRMWAPWVVIAVFATILAFTHWFLQPPESQRAAELGRLYVGTLMLLGSMLLTAMVVILTPISLPQDIQQQTIYTVVTKPVRRLEIIWGRILGYMALVTVLLLGFGAVSLFYLDRTVGGTIAEVEAAAGQARAQGRTDKAAELDEQADQMRTRMSARFPVLGSLLFVDSHGKLALKGIDVGSEMVYRSHVEGATQAKAIWRYGLVQDPMDVLFPDPQGRMRPPLDRRIPLDALLVPGTIEELSNQIVEIQLEARALEARRTATQSLAAKAAELSAELKRNLVAQVLAAKAAELPAEQVRALAAKAAELAAEARRAGAQALAAEADELSAELGRVPAAGAAGLSAERQRALEAKAAGLAAEQQRLLAEAAGLAAERQKVLDRAAAVEQRRAPVVAQEARLRAQAQAAGGAAAADLRRQADALHSPPIPVEMTFNVYRTTKGQLGEPVYASIKATNPNASDAPFTDIFPIREYYTNKLALPASLLIGSQGALVVEIQCISPTQYLGMAEGDLFLLTHRGSFAANYLKGLCGIWLQALVLTAIGVCAGTFLSWPVAFLTAFAFLVAGQVAFTVLSDFATASLLGGGPFESLIRLLSHENQMTELDPTMAVVTAKAFDALVTPILSRLVYIVPNFSALDVSNTVADGFAVGGGMLLANLLLCLGYALPFSVAGYFILKNREVAA